MQFPTDFITINTQSSSDKHVLGRNFIVVISSSVPCRCPVRPRTDDMLRLTLSGVCRRTIRLHARRVKCSGWPEEWPKDEMRQGEEKQLIESWTETKMSNAELPVGHLLNKPVKSSNRPENLARQLIVSDLHRHLQSQSQWLSTFYSPLLVASQVNMPNCPLYIVDIYLFIC